MKISMNRDESLLQGRDLHNLPNPSQYHQFFQLTTCYCYTGRFWFFCCNQPSIPTFLRHSLFLFCNMDFSQLNSAEQAHMTKIIEKKQVCILAYSLLQTFSRFPRCKTSCVCTRASWKDALPHVVMTSLAKPCLQKR